MQHERNRPTELTIHAEHQFVRHSWCQTALTTIAAWCLAMPVIMSLAPPTRYDMPGSKLLLVINNIKLKEVTSVTCIVTHYRNIVWCQVWNWELLCLEVGSVPYRPQTISATTISATNHIGHDHIGHTKRPYRPKGITTKNVLLFSANIYKLSVETRNVVHNPVSHKWKVKERNNCRHISKRFDGSI